MDSDKELLRRAAKAAPANQRIEFKLSTGELVAYERTSDTAELTVPATRSHVHLAVQELLCRIAELEAALRPFPDALRGLENFPDPYQLEAQGWEAGVTVGDLRCAAAALGSGPSQPEGTPAATSGSSRLVHGGCVDDAGQAVPREVP